jgi:hypothetical protein
MWRWDQGRLAYFQFDALRQISSFVVANDFKAADRDTLAEATGLQFSAPATHSPWRNYSRVLKLCLLISEVNGTAQPTPVASILSQAGMVTCDEYLHFLVSAFTDPSPALENWKPNAEFHYPLLFSLKYLLTKAAINVTPISSLDEIIGAYKTSGYKGDENDEKFISIIKADSLIYESVGKTINNRLRRQARESLNVISQISYLHFRGSDIIVSLNQADAQAIFQDLSPVEGVRAQDKDGEIRRLADLFRDGSTSIFFDYPNTIVEEVVESGFREGNKVKKTHVTIERNTRLRSEFFLARPTATCDVCKLDTARTYQWTERIIDLHHLLPLSSGTRVEAKGTTFDDLVPVCPNCHRAIHRFYDVWLDRNNKRDFANTGEARAVYQEMKSKFSGLIV